VYVPELELELSAGTLGGMVTTVEGLIVKICEGMFSTLTHAASVDVTKVDCNSHANLY
jgi:C4-type Zn-finger protein